ncbi:MAG TPA: hypothetical protein V6C91_04230 [Coleofasciculaceae cyanobacterium]
MSVEAQRQIEQERSPSTIAQAIRQSIDLTEILKTTVTEIRQSLACNRVIFPPYFRIFVKSLLQWGGINLHGLV